MSTENPTKQAPPTSVVSFQADDEMRAWLDRAAREQDRSVSAVIRFAIREQMNAQQVAA